MQNGRTGVEWDAFFSKNRKAERHVTACGMADHVKVYTVNGTASGSASSLPDWLTRKRAAKGRRAAREHVQGAIDLIQHFEFPEASIRVRTTRDGHYAIATGVYKPQMRVWDLDQLTLKFERHSDTENVDFLVSTAIFSAGVRIDLCTHRFYLTTGQKRCISNQIEPSNFILKAVSTTAHDCLTLVGA